MHMNLVRLMKMCLKETYIEVRIGKNFPVAFSTENYLKQGDDLSPLLFDVVLEFNISKAQENLKGMELSGKQQLLVYDDDVNILDQNISTGKRKTKALLEVSREAGLELSGEKTKHMVLSRHQHQDNIII